MDQISPPMRIALAVAVVFAAAYMLVLKPSDDDSAGSAPIPVTAPPAADAGGAEANTGLGKAVEGAREAAGAAESAAKARAGETEAVKPEAPTTSKSAPAPAAKTAPNTAAQPTDEALADLPQWLRESVDRKVVALLFTNRESADDRRTERALKNAYDGDGAVVTRAVDVAKIADYQLVAEGVDVSQSPTLMVIARNRTAHAMSGYASLDRVNQMIIDGLLATENPVKDVEWLQLAQREGKRITNRSIIGVTEGTTPAGAEKNLDAVLQTIDTSLGKLRNAPVSDKYADVKKSAIDYLESEMSIGNEMRGLISPNAVDVLKIREINRRNDGLSRKAILELNAHGVTSWN